MAAASFVQQGKKIVAIGRNYSEHAKELNNAVPKEPIIFLKPTTSYLPSGGNMEIPKGVVAHYEVELGVVVGKRGREIPESEAESYVAGYGDTFRVLRTAAVAHLIFPALAVDMTARNLQEEVKSKRLPWTVAKGFDTFTPISSYIPKEQVADSANLALTLKVNGTTKQDGNTKDMIFPIPRLIHHISTIMTLEEGDLILTGTPSGVGPIVPGDKVECTLKDSTGKQLASLEFNAVQREAGYHYKPE
ncbi:Acylpyruvase FAHD1, mitochondrial [Trametes pubescens]|uniref:Acylpyruvase FAHD1, mitochondrial n=1 Tax=Trametes pubescens TaxID=154538 RepID=A0A1M2VMA6_TRAPU|nr:Acylpyruvase FAHD1, mitochondrial [Trametes pubescens]